MSEEILIPATTNREEVYLALIPQVKALLGNEKNLVANSSNLMAVLKQAFGFLWVGCYFCIGEELVLGPFRGPLPAPAYRRGKGVCGKAWETRETIVVPDVDLFPGHIACSSLSRSEIVVPLIDSKGNIYGVLDIDSSIANDFSETDSKYLNQLAEILGNTVSE